jgi:N utilization substance protein B
MGKRRQARELAMQALYFLEEQTGDPEQALELFCRNFTPPRKSRRFFFDLVNGVQEQRGTIDGIVENYSDNWKVFRMPRVDRNVIRISVYEMLWHPDIPYKVSINEAIDIGKRFGAGDSGAFINGILDRIRKALENGEIDLPDTATGPDALSPEKEPAGVRPGGSSDH